MKEFDFVDRICGYMVKTEKNGTLLRIERSHCFSWFSYKFKKNGKIILTPIEDQESVESDYLSWEKESSKREVERLIKSLAGSIDNMIFTEKRNTKDTNVKEVIIK